MKIYWSMDSIPELDGLERPVKLTRYREIWSNGHKRLGKKRWLPLLAATAAILLGLLLLGGSVLPAAGMAMGLMSLGSIVFIHCPAIEHGRVWYREHYRPN